MATTSTEDYCAEISTVERLRAGASFPIDSKVDTAEIEPDDHFEHANFLGLIDIEAFAKLQLINSGPIGKGINIGSPSLLGSLFLGRGGSFVVRRVSSSAFTNSLIIWDEPFDKTKGFVVIKQPISHAGEPLERMSIQQKDFKKRLYDTMMELKVSYHEPLRKHPNIVKLHSFMWYTQSNLATALAPSLILEFADLGTLSDFQDSRRLILHADTKNSICLDVARGLSFLHKCGIIHGNVKRENIFLFRDDIHNKHRVSGIRAKVGDFGSAMIGVLDEPGCPKQTLPARTQFCDAPEKSVLMDALGLRRMDLYSYGLAVWKIMCNGGNERVSWDLKRKLVTINTSSTPKAELSARNFLSMRQRGDKCLLLAIETLKDRAPSDVHIDAVTSVLEATIRQNPASRALSFENIIKMWDPDSSQNHAFVPESKRLTSGDFGITDTRFPHYINLLRTTPASFRSIICNQLAVYAKYSSTNSQKALYHLALSVCHFQGFFEKDVEASASPSNITSGATEVLKSAELGNPIAQSLAPSAFSSLPGRNRSDLKEWLVNATRHGSIRARNQLQKLYPETYSEAVTMIKAARHELALKLTWNNNESYASSFFDKFPLLDPAAKGVLFQSGVTLLHQAAYLGNLKVCKDLIEAVGHYVDVPNTRKETPLHYAVRGGQLEATLYLLDKGANVNARRDYGATALHFAFTCYDTEVILKLLLSRGADIHISNIDSLDGLPDRCDYLMGASGTPLHFAIRCEQIGATEILLETGSLPNEKIEYDSNPLQTAIEMHSMPLVDLLLLWITKDFKSVGRVHDLYNPLIGFYARPMFRWLYWRNTNPMDFILAAAARFKAHRLSFDERVLFSWAFDADDGYVINYYLNKFWTVDGHLIRPFREYRCNEDGESNAQDFPLTPDLKQLLSLVLPSCSKQTIRTVISYMDKPIPSCDDTGKPFMSQLAFRQDHKASDVNTIVSMMIEAGIDIKATVPKAETGPLRNAAAWNNASLADALLDHIPTLEDIQGAMEACLGKGQSLIARQIMRSIFEKFPQVLLVPLSPPAGNMPPTELSMQPDCNYIRTICKRNEFSTKPDLPVGLLSEVIDHTRQQPGGIEALRERLSESRLLQNTPLHCTAATGKYDAAEILLDESANVNTYDIYPGGDSPDHDFLSSVTCEIDLDTLDEHKKFAIYGASGGTPLDEVYSRNWELSLFQWLGSDQPLIKELRDAGGAFKEEDAYEERTRRMIELLRARGGKTKNELFGMPDFRLQARKRVLRKMRERYDPKPPLDVDLRIYRIWGAAVALPSAQITLYRFPGLRSCLDPTRPRFSALYEESIELFTRILSNLADSGQELLYIPCKDELTKYQTWAQKNGIKEKEMDSIADVPPLGLSTILSASIFLSLQEIIYTLGYLQDVLAEMEYFIDRDSHCLELLKDLERAVGVLTAEEMDLQTLSNLTVAEVDAKLNVKTEDLDSGGYLKSA